MWGHMHRRFDADLNAPRAARRCISDWLHKLGWTGPERDDVVFAVSEAITNAAEHAYPCRNPGTIILDATTVVGLDGTQRIQIAVADHGIWRVRESDPFSTGSEPVRGRGLAMIREVMAQLQVDANADGTRLTMISRAAPPITTTSPADLNGMAPTPVPLLEKPVPPAISYRRGPQIQQAGSPPMRNAGGRTRRGHLRAISGGRSRETAPTQRLLIDLVESRQSGRAAWTADLRTTGIPAFHADGAGAIHIGWHAEFPNLVDELHRVVSVLREWWPGLVPHTTLRGSAAAARRVASLHGIALPR